MSAGDISILAGWIGLLCGVIAGSIIGLFFHREDWLGGYGAFQRRMLRLGHISFFGLGFVNILFGVTVKAAASPIAYPGVAAGSFIVGAITMPLCCYFTAWRKPLRQLFPIPVASVALGIILILIGRLSN